VNSFNVAKATDFGISRVITDLAMTFIGTPVYMAPEIWNKSSYSEKADVYSWSLVLYFLVARKEPYSEVGRFDLAKHIAVLQKRPIIPDYCPPDLSNLMSACWDPDPDKRPSFSEITTSLFEVRDPKTGLLFV
jgi:serine/threonine protein kinase